MSINRYNRKSNVSAGVISFLPQVTDRTSAQFLEDLIKIHDNQYTTFNHVPTVLGRKINLLQMYNEVAKRGGIKKMSEAAWIDVMIAINVPVKCSNSYIAMRSIYQRFLEPYERMQRNKATINEIEEELQMDSDSASSSHHLSHHSGYNHTSNSNMYRYKSSAHSHFHNHVHSHLNHHHHHYHNNLQSINPVSMMYKSDLHQICTSKRKELALSTDMAESQEMQSLELSLRSGLENELDLALNCLLILSASLPSSIPSMKCETELLVRNPRLLESMLFSVGICDFKTTQLQSKYDRRMNKCLRYWDDIVIHEDARLFLHPRVFDYTKKDLEIPQFDPLYNIFGSLVDELTSDDKEGGRILCIATVLRNLAMENPSSSRIISQDVQAMRFVILCCNSTHYALRQVGLDILAMLRFPVVGMLEHMLSAMLLELIESEDRYERLRGLELLSRLSDQRVANENASFFTSLPLTFFAKLISNMIVHDLYIVVMALDAIYCLSEVDAVICSKLIECSHEILLTLYTLLSLEAQVMGSQSLFRIRVMQGPTNLLASSSNHCPTPQSLCNSNIHQNHQNQLNTCLMPPPPAPIQKLISLPSSALNMSNVTSISIPSNSSSSSMSNQQLLSYINSQSLNQSSNSTTPTTLTLGSNNYKYLSNQFGDSNNITNNNSCPTIVNNFSTLQSESASNILSISKDQSHSMLSDKSNISNSNLINSTSSSRSSRFNNTSATLVNISNSTSLQQAALSDNNNNSSNPSKSSTLAQTNASSLASPLSYHNTRHTTKSNHHHHQKYQPPPLPMQTTFNPRPIQANQQLSEPINSNILNNSITTPIINNKLEPTSCLTNINNNSNNNNRTKPNDTNAINNNNLIKTKDEYVKKWLIGNYTESLHSTVPLFLIYKQLQIAVQGYFKDCEMVSAEEFHKIVRLLFPQVQLVQLQIPGGPSEIHYFNLKEIVKPTNLESLLDPNKPQLIKSSGQSNPTPNNVISPSSNANQTNCNVYNTSLTSTPTITTNTTNAQYKCNFNNSNIVPTINAIDINYDQKYLKRSAPINGFPDKENDQFASVAKKPKIEDQLKPSLTNGIVLATDISNCCKIEKSANQNSEYNLPKIVQINHQGINQNITTIDDCDTKAFSSSSTVSPLHCDSLVNGTDGSSESTSLDFDLNKVMNITTTMNGVDTGSNVVNGTSVSTTLINDSLATAIVTKSVNETMNNTACSVNKPNVNGKHTNSNSLPLGKTRSRFRNSMFGSGGRRSTGGGGSGSGSSGTFSKSRYNATQRPHNLAYMYICEWDNCLQSFDKPQKVYGHVYTNHFMTLRTEVESKCLWARCQDTTARTPLPLLNHVNEQHCNNMDLEAARQTRLANKSTGNSNGNCTESEPISSASNTVSSSSNSTSISAALDTPFTQSHDQSSQASKLLNLTNTTISITASSDSNTSPSQLAIPSLLTSALTGVDGTITLSTSSTIAITDILQTPSVTISNSGSILPTSLLQSPGPISASLTSSALSTSSISAATQPPFINTPSNNISSQNQQQQHHNHHPQIESAISSSLPSTPSVSSLLFSQPHMVLPSQPIKEGPVTKHIRYVSAMILRNLCRHCQSARRFVATRHLQIFEMSISSCESARALSECLFYSSTDL